MDTRDEKVIKNTFFDIAGPNFSSRSLKSRTFKLKAGESQLHFAGHVLYIRA